MEGESQSGDSDESLEKEFELSACQLKGFVVIGIGLPDELHIGRTGSVKKCALVVRVVWTKCVDSQCCLLSRSRSFSTRQLAL